MHPTAQDFLDRIRTAYEIDPDVHEFPEGTRTAGDAAAAIGCEVSQIVKSLVFMADGEPVVVLTAGNHRVDESALAEALGVESVRAADADEAKAATGWSIGGVPPCCHRTHLPTYLDSSLLTHRRVWAAAGTPEAVIALTPEQLQSVADPTPVDAFVDV